MNFQIREGRINMVIFEDYDFVLVVDWRGDKPTFRIVKFTGTTIESLTEGNRVPVRGILTKNTIEHIKESEMWENFLRKLGAYGLIDVVIEAGKIMAELLKKEREVERKMKEGVFQLG